MQTKVCSKCKKELPETSEFFYKTKLIKSGFKPQCKACQHQYYSENRNIGRACTAEGKERRTQRKKEYMKENDAKIKKQQKKYREIHKMELSQKRKDFTKANKERMSLRKKELMLINPDKVLERRRRYNNSDRGKERFRLNDQRRRAKSKQVIADYNIKKWEMCKIHFDNKCCYCGKTEPLTQDHFIPLSKGGEYTRNNIMPACKSCNSSKNNKNFFEWYPEQKCYSKKREQKILKYLNYDTKTQYQQLALC